MISDRYRYWTANRGESPLVWNDVDAGYDRVVHQIGANQAEFVDFYEKRCYRR